MRIAAVVVRDLALANRAVSFAEEHQDGNDDGECFPQVEAGCRFGLARGSIMTSDYLANLFSCSRDVDVDGSLRDVRSEIRGAGHQPIRSAELIDI
jgi:hypothetical protein